MVSRSAGSASRSGGGGAKSAGSGSKPNAGKIIAAAGAGAAVGGAIGAVGYGAALAADSNHPAPATPAPPLAPPPAPTGPAPAPVITYIPPKIVDAKGDSSAPPPTLHNGEPSVDDINSPYKYAGAHVYDKNPCRKYGEDATSKKNGRRKDGCRNAAGRFMTKEAQVESENCPNPNGEGRCFEIRPQRGWGRCYVLVGTDGDKPRYELLTVCTPKGQTKS